MKKIIGLIIWLPFLFPGCKNTNDPMVILKKTQKQIMGLNTIQYNLTSRIKHFGSDDTLEVNASVFFQRLKNDQLTGYKMNLDFSDRRYIYNPPYLYQINADRNMILKVDAKKDKSVIYNDTLINEAIFQDLLYTDFYMHYRQEGFITELTNETKDHWNIEITYPPEAGVKEISKHLRIRKDLFLPDKMTYFVHYQNEVHHKTVEINHLMIDLPPTEDKFSVDKYIKDYPLKTYLSGKSRHSG